MNHELPSVAGQMEMTHEAFESACRVKLAELQENHLLSDNSLFYLLCEAIRCSRESDAKTKALEELVCWSSQYESACWRKEIGMTCSICSEVHARLLLSIVNARKALGK